jgi:hypothetical protein
MITQKQQSAVSYQLSAFSRKAVDAFFMLTAES